ncbi:MAG: MMPL family transporter, partial [Lautropia sp.]|nr:MMPL family transporter [Lautropia sp.]
MKVRIGLWLGLVAACLLVISGTRFTADMSAFLPASPTAAQQLLVDQLRHGPVARVLLLAIAGPAPSAPQRAQLSQALTQKLRGAEGFAAVTNGAQLPGGGEQELLFRYRYLLGDAVDAGRFTSAGLRSAIRQSLQDLASPMGLALKDLLVRDPTGEMLRLIDQLEPAEAPASNEGVWSSGDGTRALVLVQLKEDGTELDAQEAALATIRRAFEEARQALGSSATLEVTGAARFAVEARHRIRSDVERLSLIGSALILLLLGFIYRSPRLLLLGVVPVASGALASIAAVSLVFGQVHGITLGFGIALIGEAIDYAIYIFIQGNHARLWRTIRLGVLTSLIGFSTLLWSGFPGLSQLGLFAVTGILTAALVTGGLLGPLFARETVPVPAPLVRALGVLLRFLRRLRWLPAVAAAGALAVLLVLSLRQPLWEPSLEALSPVGEAGKALDTLLRSELKAPDMRYVVALVAGDANEALAGAQAASGLLQPLVERGVLAGFESPSRLLPDRATQLRRRDALPQPQQLQDLLAEATAGTPLRTERLAPFLEDVERSRQLEPLRVDDVAGTAIGLGLDSMMVSGAGRSTAILPLRAPDNPPGGAPDSVGNSGLAQGTLDAPAVRAALATYHGPGAIHLIDIKAESDALYAGYLREAILLASAGLALIVLLIAVVLRFDWRRLYRVVLPIAASLTCVIAGLAAAGIGLTILHLVGLLLAAAVGSNYTLFFIDNDDDDPRLLASLALANA